MDKRTEEFLDLIFGDTTGSIELRAINASDGIKARIFARSMQEIDTFVSEHSASENIYFGVCSRKIGAESGTKYDVQEISCFWADMDFKDYGQEKGTKVDLKKGEEAARKILATFESPPCITVNTGGGLQLFWLFTPRIISDLESIESVLRGISEKLSSDTSACEVARVLRLPFTTNFPTEKKLLEGGRTGPSSTTIEGMVGYKYDFDQFSNYFRIAKDQQKRVFAKQKIKNIAFEEVREKFEQGLKTDFLLQATWQGIRTDYSDRSRSGHDMALAHQLAKARFSSEEIKAILKKFPYGKREDGSETYFDLTVSKSIASIKNEANISGNDSKNLYDGEALNTVLERILSEIGKPPTLVELSEIEESEPIFLKEPFILGDAVTILAGDGGGGKSQIALTLASEVCGQGNVCIFSNEDKPGTIKKRLRNQGANFSKISLCPKEFDLSSRDGQKLVVSFLHKKNPVLVVFDSLASYSGNKDLNKSGDVRQIINFLNLVARHFKCAVLVILHLNKGDGRAIYKISGSTQIVAAARSVLIAGCKPDEKGDGSCESQGAIFHIKANESKKGKPLGYSLGDGGLRWTETGLTISDILSSDIEAKEVSSAAKEAKDFLLEILSDGPKKVKEIQSESETLGIAGITLRRARESLKIKTIRRIDPAQNKKCGFWILPTPQAEPEKTLEQ